MSKAGKVVDETLGIVNSALTILNDLPQEDGNGNLNLTISPITFIFELLKNMRGTDFIINLLSEIIVIGIVPLEVTVKIALMTMLKNLISCSLNPIIPNELLKYGMVFDIREIDIFNQLVYSPLNTDKNTWGSKLYFGCQNATIPDELRRASDFNAFLWYMINRSNMREIWTSCYTTDETPENKNKKHLNNWQNGVVGNGWGHKIGLKPIDCVDIIPNKTETVSEYQTKILQWDVDSTDNLNYTILQKEVLYDSKTNPKGFVYEKENGKLVCYLDEIYDDFKKEIDVPFFKGDNIYQYKTKQIQGKNCLLLNREYGYVKYDSIKKRNGKRCGLYDFEKNRNINESDINNNYYQMYEDTKYYYCDSNGRITNQSYKKAIKLPTKDRSYQIKTNLITGEKKLYTYKEKVNILKKLNKESGIITLEYHENSSSVLDAEGNPLRNSHIPDTNCLQVFIGNVQPTNMKDIIDIRNKIFEIENTVKGKQLALDKKYRDLYKAQSKIDPIYSTDENGKISSLTDEDSDYVKQRQQLDAEQQALNKEIENCKIQIESHRNSINQTTKTYRKYTENYYYRRTLTEFVWDYILSVKLYDAKVVAAQLIETLINSTAPTLNLSYEEIFLMEEVKKMVDDIIKYDDTVVNDCFFSFSNKEYNTLIQKSEKIHQGLYVSNNSDSVKKINVNDILDSLNQLDEDASQEEQQTIIKGALNKISGEITNVETENNNRFALDYGSVEYLEQLLNNLLNNLVSTLVRIILSPKVYLIIAINLKILGEEPNFSIEAFINKFKTIIVELIRTISDKILQMLTEKIMSIFKDITIKVGHKISLEQAKYVHDIMRRIGDCFRFKLNMVDFTADMVDYADIYEQPTTPPTEC